MTVLVTGAPGWLGTRLVEALAKGFEGEQKGKREVRCIIQKNVDITPLKRFNVEIFEGDIREVNSLKDVMRGVETIFHTAAIIHPKKIKDLFEVNTEGTRNVLNAAVEAGAKRFIYVSSNSPAGCNPSSEDLFTEDAPPNPYMAYGRSKYQAELIVKETHAAGKIETVIMRPCWFYGPNQPARQTRFFKMIKSGRPIIFGDGQNKRSMSYIDNVVQGLLLAEKSEKANGQTYWIADKRPYKVIEIYETVSELLEVKNFRPRFLPGISSEIFKAADSFLQFFGMYCTDFHVAGEMNKNIACSIEKAEKGLGYKPSVELKEGMRRSIEWCREQGIEI